MNKKDLIQVLKENKVDTWEDFFLDDGSTIESESDVGVVINQEGMPELFVFDTAGFLDLLSAIDRRLFGDLDGDAYHSAEKNLAG